MKAPSLTISARLEAVKLNVELVTVLVANGSSGTVAVIVRLVLRSEWIIAEKSPCTPVIVAVGEVLNTPVEVRVADHAKSKSCEPN